MNEFKDYVSLDIEGKIIANVKLSTKRDWKIKNNEGWNMGVYYWEAATSAPENRPHTCVTNSCSIE